MRRVNSSELIQWSKDHSFRGEPFPILSEKILKEMEKRGMIFEIRETEEGTEYPYAYFSIIHHEARSPKDQ